MGPLEVRLQDGCPVVPHGVALKLIQELEDLASVAIKSLQVGVNSEVAWIQRLVNEHPVFASLPAHLKEALVESPAENLQPLANRRIRKLWHRQGVLIHAFSGENQGYTLRRAFHEVGGDKRLMYEFDVLHGAPEKDLGPTGKAYPLLLRLALDGLAKGWIAGPPCRTRSMLRHIPLAGQNMPRPLRAWGGHEHGLPDLSRFEQDQVFLDDVLMLRLMLLYVVSEEIRKVNGVHQPTSLFLEQPADLAQMPEVVTLWRTPTWRQLEEVYGLKTQTFNQSEFAALATKPTTAGGNLPIQVPLKGRKGEPRSVEGKSKEEIIQESKSLARWPPLMMRAIAEALQTSVIGGSIKMRALSWKEHVAAGHTPFRKDCLVCQQASAKDQHHRRSKLPPRAGVLSLDLSGPFKVAPDLHRQTAKYLLVGAFTWLAPDQGGEDFEELEIPEVPDEAPQIDDDDEETAPLPEIRDEDDVWGELQEERNQRREKNPGGSAGQEEGSADQQGPGARTGFFPEEVEKREETKEEERQEPKIVVTRLCMPIQSKRQTDVLRAIIDMYLRLRSDGYVVTQLHTDRGGEFTQAALDRWCASRTILHTYTAGDQPQSNGRVEVSVQWIKAEIRRILHAANAPFSRWPLAARNLNERLRLRQVGKQAPLPPFLTSVLIRKRYWRTRELLPTQEKALYVAPSWIHRGHWVQREDGSFSLTRMVMHQLTNPPQDEDWIGLEDELAPTEVRRRIRGKVSLNHLSLGGGQTLEPGEEGKREENEEEEREKSLRSMRRVIEQEMRHAVEDDPLAAYTTMDAVAVMKEMTCDSKVEEVLQTKIVSQQEVKRNLDQWIPAIKAELDSLFNKKGALKKIDPEEVKRLIANEEAEVLPSKLVYTLKPSTENKSGKLKARLVACGNFAEKSTEADLFASGATAVALRAAVAMAAQRRWGGRVCDIRTAFLNAPMSLDAPTAHKEDDDHAAVSRKAIVKPPPLLISAGLAEPNEFWEVCMALYGYRQSPRLWANHRDGVLPTLEIQTEEGEHLSLEQMITEPNLWKIQKTSDQSLVGLMLVYVDDLLMLGTGPVLDAVVNAVQRVWETSTPETVNDVTGVRFLGAELYCQTGKWWMTQANYIQDLLVRNLGENFDEGPKRRTPLLAEPETREDPPSKDLPTSREAQRVVGELVWVATRTRPDLVLTINRLASLITKDPQQVTQLARHVWHYLANTMDQGLLFQNQPDENQLNIYTDASFGEICIGCHLVMWGDSMLLWKSGKQSVVTASTAEAELVEILEGALSGDAVRVVLEEILDRKVRAVSFTDSTSALAIVTGDSGSWRTRHLKKRAHILRSKVELGDWLLRHLAGSELPADLGTKVLSYEKFRGHKVLMGMFLGKESENGEKRVEKSEEKEKEHAGGIKNVTVQALRAIILFAKLAQARGERDGQVLIWTDRVALPSFADPASGLPFFLILAMVFFIGILLGAVLAWMMIYPYFHRVTLVNSSNVIPRPTFLLHPLPEENENPSAPQPRRSQTSRSMRSSTGAASCSSSAAGRSSAAGAAEPTSSAAGRSSAAGAAEPTSSAAGRSSAAGAAGRNSSAAAGRFSNAAGRPMSAPAADSAGSAGSSAAAAGTERGIGNPGLRNRHFGNTARVNPFYVSPMGQKYHNSRECRGLRNARSVYQCSRCETCGPIQTRPVDPLYGLGPGHPLHGDDQHVQVNRVGDEIYEYQPCALCMDPTN